MGMEVTASDLSHANGGEATVEVSMPNLHEKENGKVHSGNGPAEPIKFGSNGQEESAKLEAESASKTNFPKDAADEWPAEPQIHSFYLVRYRTFDDPNLKAKLDLADKEIGKRNQQRSQILDGLKAKRSDRAQVIGQLKSLGVENKQYGQVLDEKINQMKPLREALGSLRGPNNAGGREKGAGLCSSEEELNDIIRSLNYRMQHEVISLTEEKQLLREIKQLEGTREKVLANAAMRAKIQESMGQKDAIQDQVKLIGTDLDEVKKDRQAVRSKIKLLEDELKAIDNDISLLQQELASCTEKRDKAFETIHQLRKQRDEANACFYQSRSVLNNAKELAAKKDIKALEELSNAEVEKFMTSWNSGKAFRNDYEKRILASLDMRQLSRDGRMRNPNEKPLVLVEQTKPAEAQSLAKPTPKVVKEDVKSPKEQENVVAQKAQKETKKKPAVPEPQDVEEEEEYFVAEKPKKEKVIDPAKLKEIKKQEELEKQKAALERKKKLAEKAAAKAAIRAQKEAEKKQKEREKKLKKKEAASGLPSSQDESTENEPEAAEAEKLDKVEETAEAQVSAKTTKELKDVPAKFRSRGQAKRRDNALPKAILKRKKAHNYWLWAAPAAVVLVAVLLALLYKYGL